MQAMGGERAQWDVGPRGGRLQRGSAEVAAEAPTSNLAADAAVVHQRDQASNAQDRTARHSGEAARGRVLAAEDVDAMTETEHQPGDSWATIERLQDGMWHVVCWYETDSKVWTCRTMQYGPERYARTQRRAERKARRMLARFRKGQAKRVARYEVIG